MATQIDDPELSLARSRVRSFEEKSSALRQGGGTLDANGEPKLTDSRGSKSSAGARSGPDLFKKARMNMMGGVDGKPMVSGPNLSVPGGDNAITGKVGGKARGRARMDNWDDVDVGSETPREAMLRPTKLNIPTVRPRRIANADGATSFHFSHEAISKTNHEKTTAKGTKNRKGAAKDHAKYIERDGAVAKAHADDLDKIEKELQDIAKTDPELAERLGLAQDNSDTGKVAEAMGVGALAGIYIEREEALAHDDNGSAVLFTNISEDPKERRDFWQEVEKREANPSEDRMRILLRGNEEFWKKVAEDEDCPKILRQSIEAGDTDQEVVVRTGDNEEVRKLMSRYGWRPREKRPDDETDEQKAAREDREAETSFGARFEDGRGGRVQFRVVGELPYDVDPEARVRILKGFAEEFEKRNLPYIAVMHSPDHTNDDRNWHFHLVYHDRPVSRFTGKAEDHLWELADDAPRQVSDRHAVAKAALETDLSEHHGKWDFSIPYEYQTACRHKKTAYPFAKPKDREVNGRKFIPSLRKKLAELTNRELEAASKDRRLDPRKYSEMGIHKRPDVHLGTQAARLESLGVPTEAGVFNEENQWEYIRDNLENKRIKTEREIERKLGDWKKSLAVADVTDGERDHAEREMIRWEQEARKASEHRAIALNLQEHYERLQSRALKLEKMAEKHLKAINENRATQRQKNNASRYQEKLDEAKAHLLGLKLFMADEIGQIASSEMSAATHETRAKKHEDTVDDIVAKGKGARKERENNSPAGNGKDPTKVQAKAPASGLSKGEVEGFIKRVLDRDVRMVEENGLVVPRVKTDKDLEVIGSEGYERTQKRLGRVKENHDKLVAGLLEAIKKNPRMLVAQKAGDAERIDANPSERFRLASKDRRLQQAWRMFADEPDVAPAVEAAIKTVRDQKRSNNVKNDERDVTERGKENAAPARPDNTTSQANGVNSSETASVSDKVPASSKQTESKQSAAKSEPQRVRDDEQNQRKEVERVLDLTRAKFLRPAAVRMGDKLEITFSREDVALYKAPANLVIEDKRSVARMEGILGKHDRAVKRVVAYLAKNPSAIAEKESENGSPLAATAPKELVKLAKDYARDPQVRRAVEDAVIRNRLDKFDPRKTQAEEIKAEAPVSEAAKTSSAKDQSKDKSELVEQNDKPAKTEEKADKKEPAKEPEQPSLFVRGPDGRLRRNVQPTEDREYGVRRISGEDAAATTSSANNKNDDQSSQKRRGAILSDDAIAEGSGKTYERSNGRKLEKGVSPKLDAWIEADEKRDRDAREKAAAIIREDRRLLASLEEYDPQVRARLQRDWDGIEDRTRQRGRGISDRDKNR
ncbi:MAG: hypothetical protein CMN74_02275 [Sphingorhabdus sp.]|nr:hypothetical protein [Sphingorhabdus sp.]|tara:strand:- start:11621 stop:15625 length:4005 start_codon:yes stop_codon:yes gene_type:complete